MGRSGCCLGSLGCLIIGLILGALTVWLLIPRLTREGYTPDQAAATMEQRISNLSREARDHVGKKVTDLNDSVWEAATDSAVPPEPLLDSDLQALPEKTAPRQTSSAPSTVSGTPLSETDKKPSFP